MTPDPTGAIDRRFSDPDAGPTPWSDAERVLEHAELYWLTPVRPDGRHHVTPLIGVAQDGVVDGVFGSGDDAAAVFRFEPAKLMAFAKEPHGQTTYRFTDR